MSGIHTRPVLFLISACAVLLWAIPCRALDPRLGQVSTFAFAAGVELDEGSLRQLGNYDLIVIDAENAPAYLVNAIRLRGAIVLGYLSVGTIEPGRSWYRLARRYRLEKWSDWNEWYADVNKSGYRSLIVKRVARRLMKKGFDGFFLDNVDMIREHSSLRRGMKILVHDIASLVHSKSGLLFSQNGERVTRPMVRYLDGWNREDVTFGYDFERRKYVRLPVAETGSALAELRRMKARGLFTTTTDYIYPLESELVRTALANSCAAGAVPFVSDIELTRMPVEPPSCT